MTGVPNQEWSSVGLTSNVESIIIKGLQANSRNLYSIFLCLQMVGLAKGALESVIPYLHEREAFSQKIADFQVSKHHLISASKITMPSTFSPL